MGGMGELGAPNMMKRLLIVGQVTTTVWRLLYASGDWAERTRTLLTQLTGRAVRSDLPLSGNVLFEGVGKLFLLLDTLDTESTGGTLADAQDSGAARLRRVA
jgi:flagellar biosynthesis protein FlhF